MTTDSHMIAQVSRKGYKVKRGPKHSRTDQPIYDALAERFRDGRLYSFSWNGERWETWETEEDWNATPRREVACFLGQPRRDPEKLLPRDPEAVGGVKTWDRDDLIVHLGLAHKKKKLTKAQLVAELRNLALTPEIEAVLERA